MDHTVVSCSALETLTTKMLAIVLEACCADSVAIRLDGLLPNGATISESSDGKYSDLEKDLECFLKDKWSEHDGHNVSGIAFFEDKSAGDYILLALPLRTAEMEHIGAIAMAINADIWARQQSFSTCQKITDLVAMNIASGKSKLQLELDLAVLNSRARQLTRKTELDVLTQVENKASFEAKVRRRMTDSRQPAAMLAIDLDHFKQVNDVYGHQFGDRYLQTIADTILGSLPDKAIIGRTGGDEFCIMIDIPQAGRSYLESIVRQMRSALQRNVAMLGKPDLGKFSVGISLFPMQATSYAQLLEQADAALYSSKRIERNTTTVFNSDLNGTKEFPTGRKVAPKTMSFETIVPCFQPIVDLATGECEGFEILARSIGQDANDPAGPEKFSWMFRDHRFASKLTLHLVRRALAQLADARIQSNSIPQNLWINVTSHDLLMHEFVFDLQSVLTQFEVDWKAIVIEVSEETMLGDRNGQVFHSLQEMRRRGARVALDDFGTGYAGLTHLSEWPVDIIKIERAFVENIGTNDGAIVVIKALVMIADAMGQRVVVEGIETQEQLTAIRSIGCGLGQGFLMSPPVSGNCLAASCAQFEMPPLQLT